MARVLWPLNRMATLSCTPQACEGCGCRSVANHETASPERPRWCKLCPRFFGIHSRVRARSREHEVIRSLADDASGQQSCDFARHHDHAAFAVLRRSSFQPNRSSAQLDLLDSHREQFAVCGTPSCRLSPAGAKPKPDLAAFHCQGSVLHLRGSLCAASFPCTSE